MGQLFDFGDILKGLKAGTFKKASRLGWNGQGMWISLQRPDEHSKMTRPYLYLRAVDKSIGPWLASQTDMLADDWVIISDDAE